MPDAPPNAEASASPLRPLVRSWWLVLLCVAAAAGASTWLTSRQTPTYRATTTLVVAPTSEVHETSDVLRSLDTLERRGVVATLAKIPSAPETLLDVAQELGRDPAELRGYALSASVPPYTYVLQLEATGRDARLATDVANAAARVVDRRARDLYRIFALRTLASAQQPRAPVHPQPRRNLVVASLLGLFAGVVAAYGRAGLGRLRA
jgi:capsular polysaccharide biosynthesis protein